MEETMNTSLDVSTDVSETEETFQEIEETSGGSGKALIGLVSGVIAAVAIGATVAWRRHKKKAAMDQEIEDCSSMNSKEFTGQDIEEAMPVVVEETI